MDGTDVSAARQHGASRTSLLMWTGLAAMWLAACNPKPPEGISVICDSNGENKYHVRVRGRCEGLPGGTTFTGCFTEVPAAPIFKCYGKDEWLAGDTGDGGTGEADGEAEETEGIDREGWPTHEPSLTHIRNYCTGEFSLRCSRTPARSTATLIWGSGGALRPRATSSKSIARRGHRTARSSPWLARP
jgi:hypothetical protein